MSWSVRADGKRTEAKETIDADVNVPPNVKQAIDSLLDEFPEKNVSISTSGHHDGAGGGNATITVQTTS
jgi:hypothetical protein